METEGWNGKERRENQHLAWDGKERRQGEKRKRMFRRLMIAWIILFSAAVCYSIITTRNTTNESKNLIQQNDKRIKEIRQSKAAVTALQHTNCGLLKFLLTARKARWDSYEKSRNKADLRAVEGYETLAHPFLSDGDGATGECPLPKKILISERPLATRGG
jgi:hypothetical protein